MDTRIRRQRSISLLYKSADLENEPTPVDLSAVQLWARIFLCPILFPCLLCFVLSGSDRIVPEEGLSQADETTSDVCSNKILGVCCACLLEEDIDDFSGDSKFSSMQKNDRKSLINKRPTLSVVKPVEYALATNIARTDNFQAFDGWWEGNTFVTANPVTQSKFENEYEPMPYGNVNTSNEICSVYNILSHKVASEVNFQGLDSTFPSCKSDDDGSRRSTAHLGFTIPNIANSEDTLDMSLSRDDDPSSGRSLHVIKEIAVGDDSGIDLEARSLWIVHPNAAAACGNCSVSESTSPAGSEVTIVDGYAPGDAYDETISNAVTGDVNTNNLDDGYAESNSDEIRLFRNNCDKKLFESQNSPVVNQKDRILGPTLESIQHLVLSGFEDDDCLSISSTTSTGNISRVSHGTRRLRQ